MKLKNVTNYSQQDKSWKNILLGENSSYYTIGLFGCLLTDLTDYVNALGHKETPATLNEKAIKAKCFEPGSGLWRWGSLQNIFPDIKLKYVSKEYRGVDTPKEFFDDLRNHIDDGYWCLLEVDFDPIKTGEQMHWVSAIGYKDDTKMPIILDPWTGTEVELSVYGDIKKSCFQFYCYDQKVPFFTPADPCGDLKKENTQLTKDLSDMRDSRDSWKEKYNEIKELPKQYEVAKQLLTTQEEKYFDLNTRFTKVSTDLAGAEKRIDTMQSQLTDKNSKINELTETLKGNYSWSFVFEAIKQLTVKHISAVLEKIKSKQ